MNIKQGDFVYYDNAITKISGLKRSNTFINNECVYIHGIFCEYYNTWNVGASAPYITWKEIEKVCNNNIIELCNIEPKAKQLLTEAVHWLIQKERECSQNKS